MSDIIHVATWTHQLDHRTSQRSLQHLRSYSSSSANKATQIQTRPVSKSVSTSQLNSMAAVSTAPGIPTPRSHGSYNDDESNMSTLPDPRSRTMSPASGSSPTTPSHHPDLSNEVATLSNKLINAINHQTNLDDTLSETRHELETARDRLKFLERENKEHKELVARGILVRRSVVDLEKSKVVVSLVEERRKRAEIEKEKKNIEQELENLTTALFEEANKMVITAREAAQKEHDIVQRRNDQLKTQLADTTSLLKSHQEQLAELKQVMEHMTQERDDQTNPTAPSTPGANRFDSKDESTNDVDAAHSASIPELISPSYPTSFTHLLQVVLRADLSAYDDFSSLIKTSKNVAGSRASSGSYGTVGLGLGGLGVNNSTASTLQRPTNGSTSSLSTAGTLGSSPVTPTTPASTASTGSIIGPNSSTPLKETKFYKRALAEDIEPTLRLDTAPGLSWLARRTVLNSICDGTLMVEPVPASTKPYVFACSLCGEARKDPSHSRSHRFRTSENDNAQRYPLCKYCLGRLRSTCDFLGFLRMLKDGHWRADDKESEMAAWEESVRLREQMFWCRVGGGVVPAQHSHSDATSRSPRGSEDVRREQEIKLSEELELTGEIRPRDITPVLDAPTVDSVPTAKGQTRTSKPSVRDDTAEGLWQAAQEDAEAPTPVPNHLTDGEAPEEKTNDGRDEDSPEKHNSGRDSTQSTDSLQAVPPGESEKEPKRLSITIPGSRD